MFVAIFELYPRSDRPESYVDEAATLKPGTERFDGFVDDIEYRGLGRDGWLLSLSGWRDETSVIRWDTHVRGRIAQMKEHAPHDYRLRVGALIEDTRVSGQAESVEERLDASEIVDGTAIVLIAAKRPDGCENIYALAEWLGFDPWCMGCLGWDIFEAVLTAGDILLVITWRDQESAKRYADSCPLPDDARLRRIGVMRG